MAAVFVDANYRFIAAYQEVNARIAQRQQALVLYVTLVVSLLAALAALQSASRPVALPVEWLGAGFSAASICLALLNAKTERAISHLRNFLATLEKLNHADDFLPSYNADPRWAQGANSARRFHDWAGAVLVLGGNGIGLGCVIYIYPERLSANPYIIYISIFLTVISLLILLFMPRWSYRSS